MCMLVRAIIGVNSSFMLYLYRYVYVHTYVHVYMYMCTCVYVHVQAASDSEAEEAEAERIGAHLCGDREVARVLPHTRICISIRVHVYVAVCECVTHALCS